MNIENKLLSLNDTKELPDDIEIYITEMFATNTKKSTTKQEMTNGLRIDGCSFYRTESRDRIGFCYEIEGEIIVNDVEFNFKIITSDGPCIVSYFEINHESLEFFKSKLKPKCICPIMRLMNTGCSCGGH